jgi:hypothetical protein
MMFASPDFGAAGAFAAVFLLAWGVVWALVAFGVYVASRQYARETSVGRRTAIAILLVSVSLPCCCCFGPDQITRVTTGRYPLSGPHDPIKIGMTRDEVLSNLGPPHFRNRRNGLEEWRYIADPFGVNFLDIEFDADGRIASMSQ